MFVGIVRIELHIPAASSLKEKRHVVRSLKDRIQSMHAAVAEVDHQELWQRCALGVAVVSPDASHAREMLQAVRRLVEGQVEAVLLDWQETLQ